MIDLHLHSTCSDGSFSPAELADRAAEIPLNAAALTDHDTLAGVPEFITGAAGRFVAIGGVEISIDHAPGTLHLLGYFIDPADRPLADALARLRAGREERNSQILERLRNLKRPLTEAAVRQFAGDDVIGRPHIAQAMVAAGYVRNKREAFDRYLAKGKPAYCDRFRLAIDEAISLIRSANGLPVLSHPFTLEMSPTILARFVAGLADYGLQGIEVYYPEHTSVQVEEYLGLARRFDLVAAGGTDFHGDLNPGLNMGTGFGGFSVPDRVYEALEERRSRERT